ncbi:N-acetylglucosamine-6-phosphate deacetylase [Cercophora newfieldiana]|uniref:N-acetylglucosamine-6-phosphate deacetylase n=1 Tax=Cercophora newfieldiana TaxID=92897 RepID=A0AA39XVW3_9PEZI|nr:N-acetylglucosamine-6-phosphate deacetylase [Cercophora newfieldiana]
MRIPTTDGRLLGTLLKIQSDPKASPFSYSFPSRAMATPTQPENGITKLTNCRLVRGDNLVFDDLWISSVTGKILRSQAAFYDGLILPDRTIDLGGRIVSPGFIDCQLNGAFGFNFSTKFEDMSQYDTQLQDLNIRLVQTGVTSYLPTVTSQASDLYKAVLPHLAPSGAARDASSGSESLGAHVEGPFLNPSHNGVHNVSVLRQAHTIKDIDDMYGPSNTTPSTIKMITLAPELANMTPLLPTLRSRGLVLSLGHTAATFESASAALLAGATSITHLFNAMSPLHHRNPGIFGLLGATSSTLRPFFGLIADGIHLHPATIKIAFHAHPAGCILVTDAMHMAGLPDGVYPWTNGSSAECDHIVKEGAVLHLQNSETIAGSSIMLIDCVNNFRRWTGAGIPQVLGTVTGTPARMLGVEGVKGCLEEGADADLVVLSEEEGELRVDEVWKFGERVFEKGDGR